MNLQLFNEKQVISRIIADKNEFDAVSGRINPDLFTNYPEVIEKYIALVSEGKHPTLSKITAEMPSRASEIMDIASDVDYSVPLDDIIDDLVESWRIEKLNKAMIELASQKTSQEKIAILTKAISHTSMELKSVFQTGYAAAYDALKNIHNEKSSGVPTGFRCLDSLTGGLQPGDLVIIAAETSMGKTSLALNFTQHAINSGHGVAFISLEMSTQQLVLRMICAEAEVKRKEIEQNYLLIENAAARFQKQKLYIADVASNTTQHILGLIRSAKLCYDIKVAVVDYIQLIGDKSKQSREQEIGQTARALKNLAKELNINIVALSQLRRPTQGNNHYPTLSRLRDSGQVEEAADLVLLIYRPEMYGLDKFEGRDTEGLAQIIVGKGRNYGTGKFFASFKAEYTKFSD
jgi:replicative DNA helicase